MILVADSGSTKTHWMWTSGGSVGEVVTQGLNPRLTDEATLSATFAEVRGRIAKKVEAIYFYGAGCGTVKMQHYVSMILAVAFPDTEIVVEGDLLGACRAMCGHNSGLVGILGTGSNLCHYDGYKIDRQRVSTGFILGDEGSGNHVGRRLLKDYLEERMSEHVSVMFHDEYKYSNDEFIDRLYRQPYPNRFLASLAPFALRHRQEEYVAQVLDESFGAFFRQLDYFPRGGQLHLVGGMVSAFEPELRQAAEHYGIALAALLADPAKALLQFHTAPNVV